MHWFFTALLIAAGAGTVAFGAHLLRRLFTIEPSAGTDITAPVPAAAPVREHTGSSATDITAPVPAAAPAREHSA